MELRWELPSRSRFFRTTVKGWRQKRTLALVVDQRSRFGWRRAPRRQEGEQRPVKEPARRLDFGGSEAEGHGREAPETRRISRFRWERLPMRLTLPVCSSGSEPPGTMRTALPSLGR
jgi:hypothetical protein